MYVRRIVLCCCVLFAVKAQAAPAQRIIALSPHLVEQLFSIGVGDNIVGTTDHADYPQQAKNIPRVGNYNQLQVEKILALKPDLILAWTDGNPPADLNKLRQLGLNVVDSNPLLLTDIAKELRLLGQHTGAVDEAEQQAVLMEQGLAELRQSYSSKAKVVVFYELWQQPLSTVAQNAWPQQQLELCGATNPFANAVGDYPQVNLEHVVASQPQLIIQPVSVNEPRALLDWSRWPAIPAVKYQQFSQPDSDLVHRTSSRMLQGVRQLCADIHKTRQFFAKKS
ncbi:MAG: cobalamin-binding protein [Gammaproteobacteria bacterium]|nr:cobalamin-binding protein [Gammaproteobacteria bacterium]MBU2056693.1 cobalamin-binding protein [Gammaproteobacteria bacterium]MBU2174030.1 cobalamin-binding protein [Gammaproteobacteria bacterium]MBU2247336.1 cobalamin-binding protein [Gammaproteobacteria bacterium]MBU2345040.1 cobalamin-binding protein [Gammaproteobacteria bacterium]